MKRITLLLTSACLLAASAAFAQKQDTACGKPFSAKAVVAAATKSGTSPARARSWAPRARAGAA